MKQTFLMEEIIIESMQSIKKKKVIYGEFLNIHI